MKSTFVDQTLIRPIPFIFRFIPFFGTELAMIVYPHLYFPKDLFASLATDNPTPQAYGVYLHELTHLRREKTHGPFRWNIQYIVSQKFRLQEELAAIQVQMKYLKSENLEYNIERQARRFSSSIYLWMTTHENAKAILHDLWNSISNQPKKY